MVRGCSFSRFAKEGEGGPGVGALAPVDVWRGEDVHVDVAGRGRKKLPQGIAVPPSVAKAADCPPGEHQHDRFDYCHPEQRKHRGAGKPEEKRPYPPYRTLKRASREAYRELYHARREGLSPEGIRRLEAKYEKLQELYRAAYDWETSTEGEAWLNREKVKRAKGQGHKSPEHYAKKVAVLEEKKQQLRDEHERLWEKYKVTPGNDRYRYLGELQDNNKKLKAVIASIKRVKSQSTIGFAREWTGVIKKIAGGVEPQITAIRTGSRSFAEYDLNSGIIAFSHRALEFLAKVRDNPDILWEKGPNLRPDRNAFAVSSLFHEFLHSVNPAKSAYIKGDATMMIEEGLTESIANRMVARPDVLSALLGREVDRGIEAKPDDPSYVVYTDTMEYMAELAARKSNSDPEWFLGKWKFHTDPKTRGETILDDALGGTTDDTGLDVLEVRRRSRSVWNNFMKEAKERLPEMRQERLAQRANKAFQGAVRMAMDSLWRVPGFVFKNDKYPPSTPAPTGGGGGGPAASPGSLVPAGMDIRHTGSPPKGVGWQKLPRQGGAPGGAGAGAVEAAVEETDE